MAQRSWDNSKRNLEETKARMREKLRLKQEAEKCRRAEFEVSFIHTFQRLIQLSMDQVFKLYASYIPVLHIQVVEEVLQSFT